ncbi:hypothetical protein [Undibacterium fentianense]|uniref:Uncharacterized protein n=1 Tax=Undibacterium fentianense TaxID=2828728 RepID=A0A941IFX7_9BURK|nr:hypothetical protein [Undibacterium fentianense]MBR7801196.1 hypothetical protein [Undibacterium fentianense]
MKSFFCLIVFFLSVQIASTAIAHGNDDHEHTTPAAPTTQVAPRATAQTEDFELVAVLQGRSLIIYLDRFADNSLVADAQIEVESGSVLKAIAKQTTPGVYVIEVAQGVMEKVGKYPLSISVQAGELGDVMTASLEIPDLSEQAHDHPETSKTGWWIGLGLLLAVISFIAMLMFKRRQNRSAWGA